MRAIPQAAVVAATALRRPRPSAAAPKCGLGNGEKASGEAIKIGAIITKQPGVDFTDITKTAKAVFDCVNDNGGINGRPVEYIAEPEQTNPQQVASLATKLFEQEKVLGLAGSSSIIDCDVNHQYYEKNDIYVIAAGIARECYFGSNVRNVNMGPYFSALGAAQYLVRQKVKGLAVAGEDPRRGLQQPRVAELAKENNMPAKAFLETVPITDGPGTALKLANAAGDGGGVVLVFTAPRGAEDPAGRRAAGPHRQGQVGLRDAVQRRLDLGGTRSRLERQARHQRRAQPRRHHGSGHAELPRGPQEVRAERRGRLVQPDGLRVGDDRRQGPAGHQGRHHEEVGQRGLQGHRSYETDILCKPWSWGGEQYLSNYADRTIVPKDHKFVQKEDCFNIAAVPSNFLGKQYEESGEG